MSSFPSPGTPLPLSSASCDIINDCNINNHRAWLIFCNCSQNFINFPDWDALAFGLLLLPLPLLLAALLAALHGQPHRARLPSVALWHATTPASKFDPDSASLRQLLLPSCCQSSIAPSPPSAIPPPNTTPLPVSASSGGVASILPALPA